VRVILFVRDVSAVARFYQEKLGLPVVSEAPGFIELDAGGCRVALHNAAKANPGRTKLSFYAKDVGKVREELVRRGVRMGRLLESPGLAMCDGKDPEGNTFQFTDRP
jgi:catechol 2,3-dioxygenase-like lactoylglutathione lyase family enzyme